MLMFYIVLNQRFNRMDTLITNKMNDKKVIRAWALFDWANSAYSLVISTAIFPIYYISIAPDMISVFGHDMSDSAVYSYSVSLAYVIIAIAAPLLGGIADIGNKRLFFLKVFTITGSLFCMLLFFFSNESMIWLGTIAFIIATAGFAGSLIFYDAFLPAIVTRDHFDSVSAKGYSYGYIGSVILLLFILFMSQKPELFGFTIESTLPYRVGFVLVGLWWLGFSQYSFSILPKDKPSEIGRGLMKKGYVELKYVIGKLKNQNNILYFLTSFFFYSAGVQTVIYLATVFAEKELDFSSGELILTVLILQIVAIGGAQLFAKVSDKQGNKKALIVMILIWIGICIAAYFVTSKPFFYAIAFFVGLVLGGIQSTSRASYSKLIEKNKADFNSYFSLYDVLFYLSVVFGTFAFGYIDNLTNNLRYSVLILALFFVISLILLSQVKIEKEKRYSIEG